MVDWGAGAYEITAAELLPAARAVVDRAALTVGDDVVDLGCGTGNAALLAAVRGARVVGVDSAPRLLEVARARAHDLGVELEFREGDLLTLPVDDAAADVVLSVFGAIFAADPAQALREIRRVLRLGGRALLTAWVPAGPIDALTRIVERIVEPAPRQRFAWSDPAAVAMLAAGTGLVVESTTAAELAIKGASPESYVVATQQHPVVLAVRPAIRQAGNEADVWRAMIAALDEANEDPTGLLVHSPYVVHVLRAS